MEEIIKKVQKRLWDYKFSVKYVGDIPGMDYDLLVEGKDQVKVVLKDANFETIPTRVIVAVVDGDEITYQVCKRGVCREESSPLKIFSKVEA